MQNVVIEYDYYTLEQAREIIREENRQKAIRRAKRRARRKAEKICYIKQKLSGIVMVAIGILIPFVVDGDATMSLLIIPMGLYTIFTKEKVLMIR